MSEALVQVSNLVQEFNLAPGFASKLKSRFLGKQSLPIVHAVNDISFEILAKETVCLVGESGCGKSTVARSILGLDPFVSGSIRFEGCSLDAMSNDQKKHFRRNTQMIFQNPYASLNPRKTILQTLVEPVAFHFPALSATEQRDKAQTTMDDVGIDLSWSSRYPHELSGGQKQRVSIARALSIDPRFVVADEPVAALDVSVQAQVLNLLMRSQSERGLTYLFISHDLAVVEHIASRVIVMYLGTICETAPRETLFASPKHPYTRELLNAVPKLEDNSIRRVALSGETPSPLQIPQGCSFHPRCPYADKRCQSERPVAQSFADGSQVACHAVAERRIQYRS